MCVFVFVFVCVCVCVCLCVCCAFRFSFFSGLNSRYPAPSGCGCLWLLLCWLCGCPGLLLGLRPSLPFAASPLGALDDCCRRGAWVLAGGILGQCCAAGYRLTTAPPSADLLLGLPLFRGSPSAPRVPGLLSRLRHRLPACLHSLPSWALGPLWPSAGIPSRDLCTKGQPMTLFLQLGP